MDREQIKEILCQEIEIDVHSIYETKAGAVDKWEIYNGQMRTVSIDKLTDQILALLPQGDGLLSDETINKAYEDALRAEATQNLHYWEQIEKSAQVARRAIAQAQHAQDMKLFNPDWLKTKEHYEQVIRDLTKEHAQTYPIAYNKGKREVAEEIANQMQTEIERLETHYPYSTLSHINTLKAWQDYIVSKYLGDKADG
jgi:hypothetical protein